MTEKIEDNDGIFWLNEKHIEKGLDNKILREITIKYHQHYRNHIYALVENSKKQCSTNFYRQKISNQSNYGLQNKFT